jgi:threonylcarbamoyladenosine tRNA methylthiotransferase MtaB
VISFSIQSFGCRVNQAEAFSWAHELQNHGFAYTKDSYQSDLVLINTCTLTSRADRDVRQFMNRVSRLNPGARLVVTGCFAERKKEELKSHPHIWKLLANAEKEDLTERIVSSLKPQKGRSYRPYRSRALVKIQDGCDFHCSFCIIPHVRGKSVSVSKAKIMDQIRTFSRQGFQEIVLTGINMCSYGTEQNTGSGLLDLLLDIESLERVSQVRLSSLDPRFLDQALIEHITSSEKICPHFHLSLQHCSDSILHRMGRNISLEDYRKILDLLSQNNPLAALGADIMVGFPGESEEDFDNMFRFLHQSHLTYVHVFSYSPRPGTEAARWEQVDGKVKKKRASRLRELSKKKNLSFRHRSVGHILKGLVIRKENGGAQVLTSNYMKVHVPSCSSDEKEEVKVKITEVAANLTRGELVDLPEDFMNR